MAAKLTMGIVRQTAIDAGKSTAAGADGIMHLSKIVFMATCANLITPGKKDVYIPELYKAYLVEANKSKFGSKVDVTNDTALRFGVAKLRAFAHFATLDGKADAKWSLVPRTVAIVNALANSGEKVEKKTGSRYEQVLRVVRYAKKVANKAALRDDEIEAALAPAQDNADQFLKTLDALAARAEKFATNENTPVNKQGYFAVIRDVALEQAKRYRQDFAVVDTGEAEESEEDDTIDFSPDSDTAMLEAAE